MEKQQQNPILTTPTKVKLLCSYGGKIHPRPTDHSLSYLGGDTKILAVDRHVTFSDLLSKLNSLTNRSTENSNSEISIKYQLPGEDLDALVSLIDDDDVEHMMIEYERIASKPARLRLFVFDVSVPPVRSVSKDPGSGNPDYLFGFDKEYQPSVGPPLDLLQIPGMVLQENYGGVEQEKGKNGNSGVPVYRINGGVYQTGGYAYGMMSGGNQVQPGAVYNFVPVMAAEQRMMVAAAGNELEGVKVNQHKIF